MGRRRSIKKSEQQQQSAPRQSAATPTTDRRSSRSTPGTSSDGASVQRAEQLGHRVGVTFSVGSDPVVQPMRFDEIEVGRWYRFIDAEEDGNGEVGVERVDCLTHVDEQGYHFQNNGRADSAANVLAETAAPDSAVGTSAAQDTFDAAEATTATEKPDPERIADLVKAAKDQATSETPEWLALMTREIGNGIDTDDAHSAKATLKTLYAVSLVARGFAADFPTYAAAGQPFSQALDVLAPLLKDAIKAQLNINVTILEASNRGVLTDPSMVQEKLSYPYSVFETTFDMLDVPSRLALMARYRVFEKNIEKYGTIATSFIEKRMMADSDPIDQLVAELSGYVTISGGGGIALPQSAFNHLHYLFDEQREPDEDPNDDSYFDEGSSEEFNTWLAGQGYSVRVIYDAIYQVTNGAFTMPFPEFEQLWDTKVRHHFYEYSTEEPPTLTGDD